jgi:hypothetical protein
MRIDAQDIVRDTTAQREGDRRQMTIAQAFEEARWLRRMPEGILSPLVARQTIEVLYAAIEANPALRQALERGQEIFVLVEQDRAAPAAINLWADQASDHGCSVAKVEDAFRKAARWRDMPRIKTKWPD